MKWGMGNPFHPQDHRKLSENNKMKEICKCGRKLHCFKCNRVHLCLRWCSEFNESLDCKKFEPKSCGDIFKIKIKGSKGFQIVKRKCGNLSLCPNCKPQNHSPQLARSDTPESENGVYSRVASGTHSQQDGNRSNRRPKRPSTNPPGTINLSEKINKIRKINKDFLVRDVIEEIEEDFREFIKRLKVPLKERIENIDACVEIMEEINPEFRSLVEKADIYEEVLKEIDKLAGDDLK